MKIYKKNGGVSERVLCEGLSCTYKDIWNAALGEELQCQRERGNSSDLYAVAVLKDRTIVPRKMTKRLDTRY